VEEIAKQLGHWVWVQTGEQEAREFKVGRYIYESKESYEAVAGGKTKKPKRKREDTSMTRPQAKKTREETPQKTSESSTRTRSDSSASTVESRSSGRTSRGRRPSVYERLGKMPAPPQPKPRTGVTDLRQLIQAKDLRVNLVRLKESESTRRTVERVPPEVQEVGDLSAIEVPETPVSPTPSTESIPPPVTEIKDGASKSKDEAPQHLSSGTKKGGSVVAKEPWVEIGKGGKPLTFKKAENLTSEQRSVKHRSPLDRKDESERVSRPSGSTRRRVAMSPRGARLTLVPTPIPAEERPQVEMCEEERNQVAFGEKCAAYIRSLRLPRPRGDQEEYHLSNGNKVCIFRAPDWMRILKVKGLRVPILWYRKWIGSGSRKKYGNQAHMHRTWEPINQDLMEYKAGYFRALDSLREPYVPDTTSLVDVTSLSDFPDLQAKEQLEKVTVVKTPTEPGVERRRTSSEAVSSSVVASVPGTPSAQLSDVLGRMNLQGGTMATPGGSDEQARTGLGPSSTGATSSGAQFGTAAPLDPRVYMTYPLVAIGQEIVPCRSPHSIYSH
jgi:hypothetical protein